MIFFHMDLYPGAESMLFIIDLTVATQVHNVARHPFSNHFLRELVGTKSSFSTDGKEMASSALLVYSGLFSVTSHSPSVRNGRGDPYFQGKVNRVCRVRRSVLYASSQYA